MDPVRWVDEGGGGDVGGGGGEDTREHGRRIFGCIYLENNRTGVWSERGQPDMTMAGRIREDISLTGCPAAQLPSNDWQVLNKIKEAAAQVVVSTERQSVSRASGLATGNWQNWSLG